MYLKSKIYKLDILLDCIKGMIPLSVILGHLHKYNSFRFTRLCDEMAFNTLSLNKVHPISNICKFINTPFEIKSIIEQSSICERPANLKSINLNF